MPTNILQRYSCTGICCLFGGYNIISSHGTRRQAKHALPAAFARCKNTCPSYGIPIPGYQRHRGPNPSTMPSFKGCYVHAKWMLMGRPLSDLPSHLNQDLTNEGLGRQVTPRCPDAPPMPGLKMRKVAEVSKGLRHTAAEAVVRETEHPQLLRRTCLMCGFQDLE